MLLVNLDLVSEVSVFTHFVRVEIWFSLISSFSLNLVPLFYNILTVFQETIKKTFQMFFVTENTGAKCPSMIIEIL